MDNIYCTMPTPEMENIGKKLGLKVDVVNNLISVWQSINNRPNTMPTIAQLKELIKNNQKEIEAYKLATSYNKVNWDVSSDNGYEVSTRGDKRFSALVATFKEGTIIDGVDVGGRTIEDVYQHVIKKSGKGQPPAKDSKLSLIPSKKGKMTFSYMTNKRNDVESSTTIEAIRKGERIATTRYLSDGRIGYWQGLKEGDIVEFEGRNGKKVLVRITKPLTKLSDTTSAEEWSRKEGWSVNYFNTKVKPKLNEAYQMEYEYIGDSTKEFKEDFSYYEGYLPLWKEWARQNPELMDELRIKAQGKTLTDQFANTRVSQARALADILNEQYQQKELLTSKGSSPSNNQQPIITKIISGGQTGVDTIGLQIGRELGIETGGTAPRGFLREHGIDSEDIASYGLIEITPEEQADYTKRKGKSDPYTGRTELNVRNSDGTVYFFTEADSRGYEATKRSAIEWNKPFIENPTAKQLREWIVKNNIKVLNVAGNRGSKLPGNNRIAQILRMALTNNSYQPLQTTASEDQAPSKSSKLYRTSVSSYTGNITPDANTIFVFGSNPEGRHGAGAAKVAREQFGAIYGQGEGLQGNAYALPTKDLRVKENNSLRSISPEQIIESIKKLYETARQYPDKQFKVAYRNTNEASLNGYTGLEMIDMFLKAGSIPANIVFSKEWVDTGKFNLSRVELEDSSYTEGYIPQVEVDLSSIKVNRESPRAILSREMSPAEIEDGASMIAHSFSDFVSNHISDRIKELEDAIATEEDPIKKLNLTRNLIEIKDPKKNRRIIIQEVGIGTILNEIKSEYEEWTTLEDEDISDFGDPNHIRESYQKIVDNFDVLFNESLPEIESIELLKLDRNENKVEDNQDIIDDNEEINGDDTEGNRVNGNEGYTFRVRFLDPGKSARAETKRALSDIRKVTIRYDEGTESYDIESVKNDLGIETYYREDYIHSVLLGILSNMDSPDDFSYRDEEGHLHFPILERNMYRYPWMNQVISKLQNNSTLTTIFYNDFRKEYISYWAQSIDGKCFPINEPLVLDSVMKSVTRNYEQGNLQSPDSIFDNTMHINRDKVDKAINLVGTYLRKWQTLNDYELPTYVLDVADLLKTVGFNEQNIDLSSLADANNMEDNLDTLYDVLKSARDLLHKAKELKEGEHLIDNAKKEYSKIIDLIGKVTELDAKTTFRQKGNTYPSYAAPNYIETVFKRILNNDKREAFLRENYKRYKWFYEDGKWKNSVLEQLENNEKDRLQFRLKNVFYMSDIHYEDWDPSIISSGFVNEYFAIEESSNYTENYAWYAFPIFSDTEMATFAKLRKYTGHKSNEGWVSFKDELRPLYRQLVMQELERINLVEQREKKGVPKIANFDSKGKKFCFLPELNKMSDDEGVSFIDRIRELQSQKDLNGINNLIDNAIDKVLTKIYTEFLNRNPSVVDNTREQIELNTGATTEEEVFEKLEEFIWNQVYTSSQLVQIVTTDLAFYRDAVDFQKRFKEVYAAGTKLNTNSPYGRKIEKTVYIKDNIATSPTYVPLKELFKKAYEEGKISEMDYDALLYKFKNVNATDGQAYRSLSSYKSILDMLGNWTDEMEAAFNRITNDEWDISDLEIIWQTIKPFVFSQTSTPDGLGDYIKVPHQNKNSEFLLLATYQVLNSILNRSPQIIALNKFMEDYNIDVVQFESAVKVGGQGIIDINVSPKAIREAMSGSIEIGDKTYSMPDVNGLSYSDAFELIKNEYDKVLDKGQITQDEYNGVMKYFTPSNSEVYDILRDNVTKPTRDKDGNLRNTDIIERIDGQDYNTTTVHFLDYDDYMIAQPTPEHLFDVEAVYGSQFRNLITSDMPDDMEITIDGRTIKGRENILKEYQSLIVENLLEDYNKLRGEVSTIEDLQKRLLSIVKGNPKYGRDILNALELVDYDGKKVFNIPLYEPAITAKMQEIVNSMFKNSITKQHIKGAACIIVSSFGFTDKLRVNRNEDGSIKEVECYLPAYSKKMYEPFLVEDKVSGGYKIDYNKLKESDKELLNFIGYRIPTEAKYSMLPLKIVGFLPQQNGSSIMLPAEVTTIAGLDFDKYQC